MAAASWSYVYVPITGGLATCLGVSIYTLDRIPMVGAVVMAVMLGVLYGKVKSPRTWINRILFCIVSTVIGALTALKLIPAIAEKTMSITIPVSIDPLELIVALLCGMPLYFFMNQYLKRIL